jgi:EAL domain-containing protein (putative c-di-GMP-specific phosphodiesterase class I)
MEHRELALRALGELTELGVKVGIDDFGTGYSSLAYLSTLPFDCLKIDRSFVIGMDQSRQHLEIVRTIISLGRTLNKQVVAEGVETPEQLKRLRQLGATIGQGYLLARPLPPLQVQRLLDEPMLAPA